jgi:hypothetical protein
MTDTLTIGWRGPLGVVLLCLNGVLSSTASAQQPPFSDLTALHHPVAVYGDHDHRLNEADFAASVGESKQTIHDRYAATGIIFCGNADATAEVIVKNDTIVTAAHVFYFGNGCNPRGPADKCVFSYTKSDGASRTIKVMKMLEQGYKCPGTPDPTTDWAVLNLESPADGVTPYRVESKTLQKALAPTGFEPYQVKPNPPKGFPVVFVAHSADFFIKGKSKNVYPKHFEKCEVKNVYSEWGSDPTYYKTDCDGAEGSSGGGIVDGNHDNPILMGINAANGETDKQLHQAIDSGIPNKGEYNEHSWANEFIPVAGDFLRAIKRATE